MLASRSLKFKVLLSFALVTLLLLGVGAFNQLALRQVSSEYDHIASVNLSNAAALNRMGRSVLEMRVLINRIALPGESPEAIAKIKSEFEQQVSEYKKADKDYNEIPFVEGEEAFYEEKVNGKYKAFSKITGEMLAISSSQDKNASEKYRAILRNEFREAANAVNDGISEMIAFQSKEADKWKAKAASSAQTSGFISLVAICSGVALSMIFGYLIASWLAKALSRISGELSAASGQVDSASTQLASASTQLSAGATEAAASLEETVASLEELSSMVKLNADHAREASGLSQASRMSAETGEQEIKSLVSAMDEISKSSKKIEEIINVIDDIAFQTNILALNAAVEAARAGDQGRGFAVVAEAVRTLAQRSGAAAKEINALIKDSSGKVEHGSAVATRSGSVLSEILTSIRKVADLNDEIATASKEQSVGLEQINNAMNQLDQATQSNAAAAEQTSSSASEMSAQSRLLQGQVLELTAIVHGASSDVKGALIRPVLSKTMTNKKLEAENNVPSVRREKAVDVRSFKTRKGELRSLAGGLKAPLSKEEVEKLFPMDDESDSAVRKIS